MAPTPQADQLYLRFREALQLIGEAVDETKAFDPRSSTCRFRVSMSDIGVMVFLPPILRHLQAEAPDIAVEVCQIAVPDLLRSLEAGQIDVALGNLPTLERHTEHRRLFDERYVCVLREKHSTIRNGLSRGLFLAARHVAVVSPFSGHRMVEDAMAECGVHRRVVLETPHFTSVPDILAQTDLIATVPSRVATSFVTTHRLRCLPLPIAMAPFTVGMYWHKRNRLNQGHSWMRDVITQLLSAL
jgi:DNA-binding transcriptional LysR family regulator